MTPTNLPRAWEKVDASLQGVLEFPDVDAALNVADTTIPAVATTARLVAGDMTARMVRLRDSKRSVGDLQAETQKIILSVREERYAARAARRQASWQVFRLKWRVGWLKTITAVGNAGWWTLMALPRFFKWIGRLVSSPFRRRRDRDEE